MTLRPPSNLVLMRASQLPFESDWRRLARGLPRGSIVLIVPTAELPVKNSLRRVAVALRANGRRCAVVFERAQKRQFATNGAKT